MKRLDLIRIILLAFFFFLSLPLAPVAKGSSIEIDKTAIVSKVIDGDTFDISSGERIRLADIDAPEYYETGYSEAKDFLTGLIDGRTVYLDIDDFYRTDKYGRLVCVVYVDYDQTHYKNINEALLVGDYASIWNFNNEFNPYSWTLLVAKENSIDIEPPVISVVSPQSRTYSTNNIPLTFSLGEPVNWIGYCLDNKANQSISHNITLYGLSEGSHSITVYVRDNAGNLGVSDTVYFAVTAEQTNSPDESQKDSHLGPAKEVYVLAILIILVFSITAFVVNKKTKKVQSSFNGQKRYSTSM